MEDPNEGFVPRDWLEAELADTLDEDYELELSEPALWMEILQDLPSGASAEHDRADYFRALLQLQSEPIKLQSWVSYHKEKRSWCFEGRDSAGKGGVIKRITQRLNPRSPASSPRRRRRTARRPSGISSAMCPPAGGGEIVLFDRSWYNRAGVERVIGLRRRGPYERVLRRRPRVRKRCCCARASGWSNTGSPSPTRNSRAPVHDAHPGPDAQAVEAVADGFQSRAALGS